MEKVLSEKELYEAVSTLVTGYGLPAVALAMLKVIDDKAAEAAEAWHNMPVAKHWAVCAEAAVVFEATAIREFGK